MGTSVRHPTVLFFHSQQRDRGPAEAKLQGICRFARAQGWKVVVLEAPESRGEVLGQVKAWRPIGCIVDMNESSRCFTASSLRNTPTAFLDFDSRQSHGKTFRVNHNPDAIGNLAARHFAGIGVSNYAFVGYSRAWSWSDARRRSFKSHLGEKAVRFASYEFPAGTTVSAVCRRRFSDWLARLPKPCGMLLADDGLAGEVYPACAKLGLRIPDDVAVLGIDDNERFCNNLNPPLSSILLDFRQAGWMAAELLYRNIQNPSLAPSALTYDPLGIAPRASTALSVSRPNPIAEKARRLIADLAATGANAADIARRFDCSRRLVEIRFRQATGRSLLTAIREARLAKARALLEDASVPIGAIAGLCGYASDAALKTYFKRRTGQTMRESRKSACRTALP